MQRECKRYVGSRRSPLAANEVAEKTSADLASIAQREQVGPTWRARRAVLRQRARQQAAQPLHPARPGQGGWPLEAVRAGPQHREVGELPPGSLRGTRRTHGRLKRVPMASDQNRTSPNAKPPLLTDEMLRRHFGRLSVRGK